MIKIGRGGFFIAFILLACSQVAAASHPCEAFYEEEIKSKPFDGAWAFSTLNTGARTENGCILGTRDTTGITPIFNALFKDKKLTELQIREKQVQIISLVLVDIKSLSVGECSQQNPSACLLQHEASKVEEFRVTLENASHEEKDPLLQQNNWVVKADGEQLITKDNLLEYVQAQCPSLVADTCKTAVLVSAKIIRSGEVMAQLAVNHKKPLIVQDKAFLVSRSKAWNQYFNEVSVQYPWELGINSYFYSRSKTDEELAKFPAPPNSKYIVMHPSVGYERVKTPNQQSNLASVVLLEVFGYERWGWHKSEATNRWGASLVISYADITGMNHSGGGIVLHTPIKNTAIGVIRRKGDQGTETGIFINVDLAKLLMKYSDSDLVRFLNR